MDTMLHKTFIKFSKETAFLSLTVAAAVILPQLLHGLGVWFGVGGQLGQMLLPMYLPVLLIGFFRGKAPGVIAGLVTPLISFAFTAMPSAALLPFITVELTATGFLAGAFSRVKLPAVGRVFAVQAIAKALRLAVFVVSMVAANGAVTASALFADALVSLPGVLLQWAVVGWILAKRGRRDD